MTRPHPALIALAATGELPAVDDERALVHSAWQHRMTGLLLTALADRPPADADARRQLVEHVQRSREQHERLWQTLQRAVKRLAELDIEVATLKGVTAEARWYDSVGERPCRDVDLLLGPLDVHRTTEVIRAIEPSHPLATVAQPWIDRGTMQAATLTVDGVPVDIHVDPLKLGVRLRQRELVWDRTGQVPLPDGGSVRVLDPELSLILFLLHLNKDRFRYLLGFVDVRRVIERETIDWGFVARFLAAEGLTVPAAQSLAVVAETLRLDVPALPRSPGLRSRIWDVVWRPSIRLRAEEGRRRYRKRQELLPFLCAGRSREGLVNAWRVLLPPRELYEIANPTERGGYLARLVITRSRRHLRRVRG
jgi:hypothetical protein